MKQQPTLRTGRLVLRPFQPSDAAAVQQLAGAYEVALNTYARNPSSGRVLQKLRMQYEGTQRRHAYKWGEYLDVVNYGLLRDEWLSSATLSTPDGAGEERKSAGR